MEQSNLPTIKDMYNCTRENYDFNVVRSYEGQHKDFAVSSKSTKKDHYLDHVIRMNSSPGPANISNTICTWATKAKLQCKHSERKTFLDQIQTNQKKRNSPSPNKYLVNMPWPIKKDQIKHISQKTNFADTCQYQSNQIPGPGTYLIRTHLSKGKSQRKFIPHQPLQPTQNRSAQMCSYTPIPLGFNTFSKYETLKKGESTSNLKKMSGLQKKEVKENKMPGPGSYQTINYWSGKSPSKKGESDYMKFLSKGPSMNVYHS